jgi:hypothetical protein
MDSALKQELVKDVFGLGAVLIYFCTILLAAFRWSEKPGPIGAVASIPLLLFVAAYVYKRYVAGTRGRGSA